MALARDLASGLALADALVELGTIAYLRGDPTEATTRFQETLALARGTHNEHWPQRNLGYMALDAGRHEEAAAQFREALTDARSHRSDSAVLENVNAFAALARELGGWERAARLLGALNAGVTRLGGTLNEAIGRAERERTTAATREQLGEPAFAAAYAAGRALLLEEAVAEARAEHA